MRRDRLNDRHSLILSFSPLVSLSRSLSLSLSLSHVDFGIILRFMELSSILDPGRPPKMDKAVMLGDALRMVTQLRGEAQKLKESKENLQDKINEMKVRLGLLFLFFLPL
jgi:predicted transcriptional regulator